MPVEPVTDFRNYHVYNNLVYGDSWCKYTGRHTCVPNWDGGYNLYVRRDVWSPEFHRDYVQKTLGIELHSVWTTEKPGFADYARRDVSLRADSPARGAGIDLYDQFGMELPGGYTDEDYYPGDRPDVGALSYGEPMPTYWLGGADEAAPRAGDE